MCVTRYVEADLVSKISPESTQLIAFNFKTSFIQQIQISDFYKVRYVNEYVFV